MKKINSFSMFLTIGLFMLTYSVIAQPGPRMGMHKQFSQMGMCGTGGMYGSARIIEQIPDLTEDQKSKIKTFFNDYLKETNVLRADLSIKRAELRKLELADQTDQDAINKKIDEIGDLRIKIEKKRSEFQQKVRSILSKEQKLYYDNYCNRRFKNWMNY